ncbi:MAG: glycosyltransferase family 39 protein, partial [Anaerolineae bacterium]|nr:glycosyltransferase family 39 protein [Anaerolineae bacterium]
MADWLQPTFYLFPFAAWMFVGVGLPWALALLPRGLWPDRLTVLAVAMALGPIALTTIMFVLGTAGSLTLGGTLAGSALCALVGVYFASRQPPETLLSGRSPSRLTWGEGLLLAGIVLLLLVSVITAAFWPFLAYDALWVYGYNAKVFVMAGHIPADMNYYPQLVPLGYTYMQQAWDALGHAPINDHAARVIIPWFNVTLVLMAYVLGRRTFGSRRVGLVTAALWMFYPHVAAWAASGDLEIPLTLYVTGAATFFIEAWRAERNRLAILSGVLLAGALWTKPTAGALALGMMLAMARWIVLMRFQPKAILPKFRIALLAGIASIPIGGMWYVRNLLLGHRAVILPASYWHDLAQRSGQELGWPLVLAALLTGALLLNPPDWLRRRNRWQRIGLPLLALGLLLAGILPTAINPDLFWDGNNAWRWVRGDLAAGARLNTVDLLFIFAGTGLLIGLGRSAWWTWPSSRRIHDRRETVFVLWALLLPYAVVW